MRLRERLLTLSCIAAFGAPAYAQQYYPYYNGTPRVGGGYPAYASANHVTLPTAVVPARYYSPSASTSPAPFTPPTAYTPPSTYVVPASAMPGYAPAAAPRIVPAAAPVAAAPVAAAPAYPAGATYSPPAYSPPPQVIAYTPPPAPTYTPPAPAPTYTPPAPAYVAANVPQYAPAYTPAPDNYPTQTATAMYAEPGEGSDGRLKTSIGFETFYDNYEEPDQFPDLHVDTYYGAIDASVAYYFYKGWFGMFDGRESIGSSDYNSSSGSVNGTTDYEFDNRLLTGYDIGLNNGSRVTPYFGIGSRIFLDYFKHDDVPGTYDRRIYQLYMPIGMTWEFASNGWTFTPNVEIDPLLYGYVQSRVQAVSGYRQGSNTQSMFSGVGYRAEFLAGHLDEKGSGLQFGPFIRYWTIDDSNPDYTGGLISSPGLFEPANTRLQLGMKLKYLF